MDFLNGIMLFGLVAASIPIIIHLLNRRRYRVIEWGAMRFLKQSFITRHRRIRIEELILLALRTLLLVVLVLALARPELISKVFSSSGSRKDMVIVLDSSFSTALKDQGSTIFERERGQALKIVQTLSRGDTVAVVLASRTPRPLLPEPSYDFDKVSEALSRAHESLSSLDMPRSLDRALSILKKGSNPVREIVVITDGQRVGWAAGDQNRWKYLADELASFKEKPRIYVLNVNRRDTVANFGLSEMTLRRTVVGTDRDVRVEVKVTNTGEVAFGPRRLIFTVDGKAPRPVTIERLMPGASATPAFTTRFTTPGGHFISASLEEDLLPADDRAYFGLEVLESLPVLLVDGRPSPDNPSARETLFLEAVLQPTPQYVVKPTVISPSALADADLGLYRSVVLANVGQLSSADAAKLEDYVRKGGGLLIAPGDQVTPELLNTVLYKRGEGLMPAEVVGMVGDLAKRDKPFAPNMSGLTHQTLRLIAQPDKSDLADTRVYRYFKMSASGTAGAGVIARLNNGDPLLVEKSYGRGRVVAAACPLDGDWSNLPLRASYVVLAHELIYYLSSPLLPARNIPAGEPLVVKLDEKSPADEVEVALPMGRREKVAVERREGSRVAIFAGTAEAGLYEVAYRGNRGPVHEYYVVNFDPAESDLTPLGTSSREIVTNQTGAKFYSDWSSIEGALKAGEGKREIWRWLAVFTVVLLLVEIVLTRLFSGRRAAADKGVTFGTG
jgi:hypothetical protein